MRFSRTYLVVIILLINSNSGFSQSKTAIGITVTPATTKSNLFSNEIPLPFAFAYGCDIHVHRNITGRISVRAGIAYTQKAIVINDLPDTRNLIDADGNIDYNNIESIDARSNYNYVVIPLSVHYQLTKPGSKKNRFYIAGGVDVAYLYWSKFILKFSDHTETYSGSPQEIFLTLGGSLGLGLKTMLSERIYLIMEPAYAYDFYSTYDGYRFQSIRLNIGASYLLKSK